MQPRLSRIGQKMSNLTGVRAIMKDIIETMQSGSGKWINLSPGNPLILPEVEAMWREYTAKLMAGKEFGEVVGRYGTSQGYMPLIDAIVAFFNTHYGWGIARENVLITPGSQSLYFYAANCFGGPAANGVSRKIVLPLSPDYTGYGGVTLDDDTLVAYKPTIDITAPHRFKYRPDFDRLHIDSNVGAVLFSRPANPTGNVLTDDEVHGIVNAAAKHDVPVLIDSAYAAPFPNLVFTKMTPIFGPNVIHCMSLSKAGLPGERVGVAIGDAKYIEALECFQTNVGIHSSRFGQALAAQAIESGDLFRVSETIIKPFYQRKAKVLTDAFERHLPDDVPWHLHEAEGAIFAWLWLKDLPITDKELYQRIKQHHVFVVPGEPFFPGLKEDWPHKRQCLRISLTATEDELENGAAIIGRVVREAYGK